MSVNFRILASSLRKRFRPNVGSGNRVQDKAAQGHGNDLSRNPSVAELQAELKDNKFARWRQYCIGLLIVFEVRPCARLFVPPLSESRDPCRSKQIWYGVPYTRTSSQDLPMGALNTNYLIRSISEVII